MNGVLVLPSGTFKADVGIDNGKVVALGSSNVFQKAGRTIDAKGKLVIPGGIDTHTHFELPFMGEKPPETWDQGTVAAAFGGTTTVVDFAIQQKGKTLMDAVKRNFARADSLSAIDFSFHGCFTDFSNMDKVINEMEDIVKYGIPTFKEFMIYTKEGFIINDWNLYLILKKAKELGTLVGVHAENAAIGESWINKFVEESKNSAKYHPLAKPNFVEAEAIQRAISIARFAGARLYIVHMSTKEGVQLVREARKKGEPIYSETCTHYLTLIDDVYLRTNGINYILSPPLRKKDDVETLWAGLANGSVSIVGSDHVAYTSEQKKKHAQTFATVPNGAGGVEVRLPILYSEGVRTGRISLTKMVEVCCTNAAKLLGMYPRKGTIAPGSDADLVVFDPKVEKTLSVNSLHMGTDYTMYEGVKVTGYPILTISKGKVIIEDNQYIGKPGAGEFLRRKIKEEII